MAVPCFFIGGVTHEALSCPGESTVFVRVATVDPHQLVFRVHTIPPGGTARGSFTASPIASTRLPWCEFVRRLSIHPRRVSATLPHPARLCEAPGPASHPATPLTGPLAGQPGGGGILSSTSLPPPPAKEWEETNGTVQPGQTGAGVARR